MSSGSSTSSGSSAPRGRGRGRARGQVAVPPTETPGGGDMSQAAAAPPVAVEPEQLHEVEKKLENVEIIGTMARPGFGKMGRIVPLVANYFSLNLGNDKKVGIVCQRYEVDITPPRRKIDRDENRLVFWYFVKDNFQELLGGDPWTSIVYDDSRMCLSLNKLNLGNGEKTFTHRCQLPRDNRPEDYTIKFLYTGSHIVDLRYTATADHTQRSFSAVQAIDIICSQFLKCPLVDVSKNWYPWGRSVYRMPNGNGGAAVEAAVDLKAGREMWRGFCTASKVGEDFKPMINVDISNTAFYKRYSVIEYLCEILNAKQGRDMFSANAITADTQLDQGMVDALKREVKGLKIRVTHGAQPRVYKCNDVVGPPETITFEQKTGEETQQTNVRVYFENRYGPLRFPKLPCLWVGPRTKKICIPLEMCGMDQSPQKVIKKLGEQQTSALIRASAVPAPQRKQAIETLLNRAQVSDDPFMKEFGISMNMEMIQLNSRCLEPPGVVYQQRPQKPRDGVWRLEKFNLPVTNITWALISMLQPRDNGMLQDFCDKFRQIGTQLGMQWAEQYPEPVEIIKSGEEVSSTIKKICSQKKTDENPLLILVVMPRRMADVYAEVKRWGDVECGVTTQCLLRQSVDKTCKNSPTLSNATGVNIIQKTNAKLGGINNAIDVDDVWRKFVNPNEATLFLGVDVTHPGPGDERSPSIGSVIGNINIEATKWAASIKIQRHRREQMVYMTDQVRERIKHFYDATKKKPARIVVYRDGVSSGEFTKVLSEEMGNIKEACSKLSADYKPKITYIVTQKRHHTRFFCQNPRDAVGKAQNIPPGTTVDHVVIHPVEFDFFLCSHMGIQGTSRPTHYCVLHDESGWSPDDLQLVSYRLCHLYQRCTRSVSIPAPVYFADLACTRAKNHHRSFFGHLSDSSTERSHKKEDKEENETESSEGELQNSVTVQQNIKNMMYWI